MIHLLFPRLSQTWRLRWIIQLTKLAYPVLHQDLIQQEFPPKEEDRLDAGQLPEMAFVDHRCMTKITLLIPGTEHGR